MIETMGKIFEMRTFKDSPADIVLLATKILSF